VSDREDPIGFVGVGNMGGAMAARVRATGRGWVLPLGLPPAAVNNALLSLRGVASRPG